MHELEGDRLTLRPGTLEDHPAFVRLFDELGLEESAPSLDTWISELMKRSFFVESAEGIAAYALVEVMGQTGHVVNLVVAPSRRRRGVGTRVMRALALHLRERGCREWVLNVKPDNVPALALYTRMGMRVVRAESCWSLSRARLEALPPVPEGFEVVPVEEREFGPLTQAFGLVPGMLKRFAEQRGLHRLLRLRDTRHPEGLEGGWMDVRPSRALLAPFHAASPAHARGLLEAGFGALGATPSLRLVTGDEAFGALLSEAGARLVLRTLSMCGSLERTEAAR